MTTAQHSPRGLFAPATLALLLLVLPLIGLVIRAPWSSIVSELQPAGTPLRLSLIVSLSATALSMLGAVPLAWILARRTFPGKTLVRTAVVLPIVIPPVVGGVALLTAFGRTGFVGRWIDRLAGVTLPFSTAGAIVAATFVAMPLVTLTVEAGFRSMDRRFEEAATSLGSGRWRVFWRVSVPLTRPALLAGALLGWARALGEFGATITFAGNLPGRTQTLPLAIFLQLENRPAGAIALSLLIVAASAAVLVILRDVWFR